jgi:CDP-diacylglycerol--glycerol-3-phosphate 3-phosphatidyltransferase
MASIYDLKPAFQRTLEPLLTLLIRWRVTPNQVTWAALLLSLAGGLALCLWGLEHREVLLIMPLILFVRMALNALDGMLARRRNLSTPAGEVLNEVGDIVSDALLYTPLVLFVGPGWIAVALVLLMVFLAQMTEFCGVLAKSMTGQRRYDGPMGKSDRAFLIGLYCLLLYLWPVLLPASIGLFALIDLLLLVSCRNRLQPALTLSNKETAE